MVFEVFTSECDMICHVGDDECQEERGLLISVSLHWPMPKKGKQISQAIRKPWKMP